MRFLSSWPSKAAAHLAAVLLALGATNAAQAQTSGVKPPTEDDQVILQLRVKNLRLSNELRGYQTGGGVCVDLGDLIPLRIKVRVGDELVTRFDGVVRVFQVNVTIDAEGNVTSQTVVAGVD